MKPLLPVLVLLCGLGISDVAAKKIKALLYSPRFGRSHLMFVGKLADALVEAGHDVVLYQQIMNPIFANETGSKKVKRVIERPLDFEMPPLPPMDIAWDPDSGSVLKAIDMMGGLGRTFKASCEAQLRDNATIQRLIDEQFDVAMAEFFDPCSLGLFRRLGIKKTIVLYASAMPLDDSTHFGMPAQPSSVPDFIIQSPVKSFFGRFVNTMSFLVGRHAIMPQWLGQAASAFRVFDDQLDYKQLIAEASFYFVNTDELVDFPRPISHKYVNIGGLGMQKALAKTSKLDEKYKKFLDSATECAVFMSFGSVAQSHLMPNASKKAFLEAFAEFPNVHFMWKYEKPEHEIANGYPNVMAEEWFPQAQIFGHSKIRAFITHGGCNSLSEASWSGIPMIAIPLFGDQQRNAFNIEERGIGVQLSKGALTKDAIVAALRRVIYDDRYKQKAQKIARMIRAKPMSPDERFVKYTEFAAQHDVHEQLDLPGRHLNFVEFYSIDVFAVAVGGLLLAAYVLFALVRLVVRRVSASISKKKVE